MGGHAKHVYSAAFSADNRQFVSGSRDKTIKLWNCLAQCQHTIANSHTGWVSQVAFCSSTTPFVVSCSSDWLVKVWNLHPCNLKTDLEGHASIVYTIAVSPDFSLCASGGKDGTAILWDLSEGKNLYALDAGGTINALTFSPMHYWLVAATDTSIKIWDLEKKCVLDELTTYTPPESGIPWCVSVTWSADGSTLFVGSTDGNIYVYEISS